MQVGLSGHRVTGHQDPHNVRRIHAGRHFMQVRHGADGRAVVDEDDVEGGGDAEGEQGEMCSFDRESRASFAGFCGRCRRERHQLSASPAEHPDPYELPCISWPTLHSQHACSTAMDLCVSCWLPPRTLQAFLHSIASFVSLSLPRLLVSIVCVFVCRRFY